MGRSGADGTAFQAAWREARGIALRGPHAGVVQRWVADVTTAMPGQALPLDGLDGIWFAGDAEGVTALTDAVAALGIAVEPAGVFTLLAGECTTARLLES